MSCRTEIFLFVMPPREWHMEFSNFFIVLYDLMKFFHFSCLRSGWHLEFSNIFIVLYDSSFSSKEIFLFVRGWKLEFSNIFIVFYDLLNFFHFSCLRRGWRLEFSNIFIVLYDSYFSSNKIFLFVMPP